MFRALFRKEWRQLRTVRIGAIVLTIVLPIAFAVGAEASERGWILDVLRGYDGSTLWGEVFPATLAVLVWPFFAALTAAHGACAERQDGTAAFLLARPVPARVLWRARGMAAFATTTVILGFGYLFASFLAFRAGSNAIDTFTGWTVVSWMTSIGIAAATWAVAAVIPSTMLATVVGLVFALGVSFAALQAMGLFPYAAVDLDGSPVHAAWAGILFVPVFFLSAWRGFGRGEPAGAGRGRRTGSVLGLGGACVVLLFGATAWGMVRARTETPGERGWRAIASNGSSFALASGESESALIVDADRLKVVRRIAPPLGDLAWSADGSRVAVASFAGPIGSVRPTARLEVFEADGTKVGPTVDLPAPLERGVSLRWSGTRVAVLVAEEPRPELRDARHAVLLVEPESGATVRVDLGAPTRSAWWAGSTESGGLFVVLASELRLDRDAEEGTAWYADWRMYRIDAAASVAELERGVSGTGLPIPFRSTVSPSGRFVLGGERGAGYVVRNRETGAIEARPEATHLTWLHGDRLVGVREVGPSALLLDVSPGRAEKVLATLRWWDFRLEASPDRRRLLITGGIAAVWDPAADTLRALPPPPSGRSSEGLRWSGNHTLAWADATDVVLVDADAVGDRRVLFGRDSFAKDQGTD